MAEISRRELDKQIAHQAQKNGAVIKVRTSFQELTEKGVRTSEGEIECSVFVDARGVSSLIHKDRTGIFSSAQYEIYADWIKKGKVQVFFDQEKYPGFFAWVIPSDEGKGKVGVAGKGINVVEAIEKFLQTMGNHSTIRKIYAPIWIKGPIEKFIDGKKVIVGDAAGQAKPTTAGGIYSSGVGGLYAGQAISKFLKSKNRVDLEEYQKRWTEKFGKEFEKQLFASHDKMKTFSPDSMAVFALQAAGGINVARDALPVWDTNIAAYGKERILSRASEIDVFLAQSGTMNPASIEMIRAESGFQAIRAVKNNQIFIIDERLVSRPTLRLLDGIFEIGKILYPNDFTERAREIINRANP